MAGSAKNSKRAPHRKTRTGCITCKIRRVKCDEGKPACERCTSTGRRCDGYDIPFPQPKARAERSASPNAFGFSPASSGDSPLSFTSLFLPSRPLLEHRSPDESRSLQYFDCCTIPTLIGLIDTELWSRLLRQVSVQEPAIKHAMMALSAFHERCETLGVPQLEGPSSGRNSPISNDAFALQHYTKAITLLRQRLTYGTQSHTVTLLSCILFVTLEFLRGNAYSAITHLRAGLDIIRSRLPAASSSNPLQEKLTPLDAVEGGIAPTFARLSLLQSLYGQPRSADLGVAGRGPFVEFLDIDCGPPTHIESLEQARMAYVNVCNSTFRLIFMVDYAYFPFPQDFRDMQASLLEQCQRWDEALARFTAQRSPSRQGDLRGADLLQSHNWLNRMWIVNAATLSQNYAPDEGQCNFDSFEPYFELIYGRMLLVIEYFAQQGRDGNPPAFALDSGLLPVLFFAAIKCRHRRLRRRFVELIARAPRREGLWDALETQRTAELIIAVEEEPIAHDIGILYPPEESRSYDVDIRPREENDPTRQYVRLKMKPDGLYGAFVWRTECIVWDH